MIDNPFQLMVLAALFGFLIWLMQEIERQEPEWSIEGIDYAESHLSAEDVYCRTVDHRTIVRCGYVGYVDGRSARECVLPLGDIDEFYWFRDNYMVPISHMRREMYDNLVAVASWLQDRP